MNAIKIAGAVTLALGASAVFAVALTAVITGLAGTKQPMLPPNALTCETSRPGYLTIYAQTQDGPRQDGPQQHIRSLHTCSWTYTSAYVAGQGTSSWGNPPDVVVTWTGATEIYDSSTELIWTPTPGR